MSYKNKVSLKDRVKESSSILSKYSNRIPIIIERSYNSTNVPKINRKKFLVPSDLSMGQLMYIIRKRIQLQPYEAIYLFVNNSILIPTNQMMSNIYNKYKDDDGFLYITYAGENTFG